MNIHQSLNRITAYIELHLEDSIDYAILARFLKTNTYTMQRIFSVLVGIPLGEYIRKRRLSAAAYDLLATDWRVIDLAVKYNYSSSITFSRAFTAFHGIKPSQVTTNTKLKEFPRIIFDETPPSPANFEYSVVEHPKLTLYGMHINTNNETIKNDAPYFFDKVQQRYFQKYGRVKFGMISYHNRRDNESKAYHTLYDQVIPEFERIEIPRSTWLQFIINSQEAKDIQNMSDNFYEQFLPSSKYQLTDLPELEYYHDNITEFWVPIQSK